MKRLIPLVMAFTCASSMASSLIPKVFDGEINYAKTISVLEIWNTLSGRDTRISRALNEDKKPMLRINISEMAKEYDDAPLRATEKYEKKLKGWNVYYGEAFQADEKGGTLYVIGQTPFGVWTSVYLFPIEQKKSKDELMGINKGDKIEYICTDLRHKASVIGLRCYSEKDITRIEHQWIDEAIADIESGKKHYSRNLEKSLHYYEQLPETVRDSCKRSVEDCIQAYVAYLRTPEAAEWRAKRVSLISQKAKERVKELLDD